MSENGKTLDAREEWASAISEAGAATEQEMRDAKVPTLKTDKELLAYIEDLVDRPHNYGTCVYAVSMAATAAFYYVAHKLSITDFQASCADMDILGRTRGWEWGKLLDYSNLLYPQYCNPEYFPSHMDLLRDPEIAEKLSEMAKEKLAEGEAAETVKAHWESLVLP
jgi:hypothetical protein